MRDTLLASGWKHTTVNGSIERHGYRAPWTVREECEATKKAAA